MHLHIMYWCNQIPLLHVRLRVCKCFLHEAWPIKIQEVKQRKVTLYLFFLPTKFTDKERMMHEAGCWCHLEVVSFLPFAQFPTWMSSEDAFPCLSSCGGLSYLNFMPWHPVYMTHCLNRLLMLWSIIAPFVRIKYLRAIISCTFILNLFDNTFRWKFPFQYICIPLS